MSRPDSDKPRFPDLDERNVLAEGCQRCPSLADARECISWGAGSLSAELVVVGEAPGAGNPDATCWQGGNWTGMAYTSQASGKKIRRLFADLGYPPDALYYTNAVKCFPPDGNGGNREPTATERENCRPYLLEEIRQVAPTCIVATGRHAFESLLAADGRELEGFLEVVLEPVDSTHLGIPILPILHPSYEEVWRARLGHTRESYLAAIQKALTSAGVS